MIVVCAPLAIIKIYTYLFYNFDLEAVLYYRHQWLLARRVEHALLDTALEPGTRIDKHCKQCDMKMWISHPYYTSTKLSQFEEPLSGFQMKAEYWHCVVVLGEWKWTSSNGLKNAPFTSNSACIWTSFFAIRSLHTIYLCSLLLPAKTLYRKTVFFTVAPSSVCQYSIIIPGYHSVHNDQHTMCMYLCSPGSHPRTCVWRGRSDNWGGHQGPLPTVRQPSYSPSWCPGRYAPSTSPLPMYVHM